MTGCLNGGIDDNHLSGVGHTGLGIGAYQPYFRTETKLVFDNEHGDWETIWGTNMTGEKMEMPKVNIRVSLSTRLRTFDFVNY